MYEIKPIHFSTNHIKVYKLYYTQMNILNIVQNIYIINMMLCYVIIFEGSTRDKRVTLEACKCYRLCVRFPLKEMK